MNLFGRRRTPGRAADVKAWVAAALDLGPDDLISVAELACHEPGCPPLETVITIHRSSGQPSSGERQEARFHKPLAEICQADIEKAFKHA